MNNNNIDENIQKILEGCQRAFEKLLAEEKLRNGELVFADEDGNPVFVKARDFEAYVQKRDEEKKNPKTNKK
jgi:hypothetical protein